MFKNPIPWFCDIVPLKYIHSISIRAYDHSDFKVFAFIFLLAVIYY